MNFDAGTWWVVAGIAGIAITIITYFLKRTISKVDEHDKDIGQVKQTYATVSKVDELDKDISQIKQLCASVSKIEEHSKDINHIKQTYVTEAKLESVRADIKEIKENALTKADFYRVQQVSDRKVEGMEQKIDKMYMLLMKYIERGE